MGEWQESCKDASLRIIQVIGNTASKLSRIGQALTSGRALAEPGVGSYFSSVGVATHEKGGSMGGLACIGQALSSEDISIRLVDDLDISALVCRSAPDQQTSNAQLSVQVRQPRWSTGEVRALLTNALELQESVRAVLNGTRMVLAGESGMI
jgi:hypothetical protein